MKSDPFSSLTSEERFWVHVAIMTVIFAVLVFAVFGWLLFQQKVESSINVSTEQPSPAATPTNGGDPLYMLLSSGNKASTNVPAPLLPPVVSETHSN